jgi:hypothetical protein
MVRKMAVDFNQIRKLYNDRNKWYKKTDVERMKLTQDAVAQGVFYSQDTVSLTEEEIAEGNVKRTQHLVTIETPDIVSDLKTDDFVLHADGELYRVRKITRDDKSEAKEHSKRPPVMTTLELIR